MLFHTACVLLFPSFFLFFFIFLAFLPESIILDFSIILEITGGHSFCCFCFTLSCYPIVFSVSVNQLFTCLSAAWPKPSLTHDNDTLQEAELHIINMLSFLHTLRQLPSAPHSTMHQCNCFCITERDTQMQDKCKKGEKVALLITKQNLIPSILVVVSSLSHVHTICKKSESHYN